jgi:hypothetical protein
MEEEDPTGDLGDPARPQVEPAHVEELVADRHLQLLGGQPVDPGRRQQNRRL